MSEMFWERDQDDHEAICLTIAEWRLVVDALRHTSGEQGVCPINLPEMELLARRISRTLDP